MATRTYKLPTVNAAGKMSFPDAVNGLATGVDFAMRGVQKSFGDPDDYKLPVATSSTLGGVRIGDGFKVFADGEIQPEKSEFVLKPATASALGGVAIGKNVDVDETGKIIAGAGAFQSTNITESELAFGAVTGDKFRDGTILQEDLESTLINKLLGPKQVWQNAQRFSLEQSTQANNKTRINVIKLSNNLILILLGHSNTFFSESSIIGQNASTVETTTKLQYVGGAQIEDYKFGHSSVCINCERFGTDASNSSIEKIGETRIEWNRSNNQLIYQNIKGTDKNLKFYAAPPVLAVID